MSALPVPMPGPISSFSAKTGRLAAVTGEDDEYQSENSHDFYTR